MKILLAFILAMQGMACLFRAIEQPIFWAWSVVAAVGIGILLSGGITMEDVYSFGRILYVIVLIVVAFIQASNS